MTFAHASLMRCIQHTFNCSELATLPFQRPDVSWSGPISRCCVLFLALFGRDIFQGIFPWQQLLNSIFVLLGQVWCLDRPLPVYQFLEKRNEKQLVWAKENEARILNSQDFTPVLFYLHLSQFHCLYKSIRRRGLSINLHCHPNNGTHREQITKRIWNSLTKTWFKMFFFFRTIIFWLIYFVCFVSFFCFFPAFFFLKERSVPFK